MDDDSWHEMSLQEQRRHEEELKLKEWDTWVGKEHPWQWIWDEYHRWKKDGSR